MLEKLMRLYTMAIAFDVRSPIPHLVGPPGCGKSDSIEQLADLLEVQLHIINVSRLSPLEVEGVQMPHTTNEEMVLKMLPAVFWTRLKDGDILLFDEFLRGFPEVYNGLLDIFTSRRVGAFVLPKVFIIGASNSVVTYDSALEDRLLHIPVADARKSQTERTNIANILVKGLGLLPIMAKSDAMDRLIKHDVLPLYDVLDTLKSRSGVRADSISKGYSVRNLLGQAQLKQISSIYMRELLDENNGLALAEKKAQYMVLYAAPADPAFLAALYKIKDNPKLTPLQELNVNANIQLCELDIAMREKEDSNDSTH